MPVYDYECPECEEVHEITLKLSQLDDQIDCPECGRRMRRLCHNAGFILKGKCWSRDNYARVLGDDPRYKGGTYDPTRD